MIIFNNEYDSIGRRVVYICSSHKINILKIILISKCVASRTVKEMRPAKRLDDV